MPETPNHCPFCNSPSEYVATNNSTSGKLQTTFYVCEAGHHWGRNH